MFLWGWVYPVLLISMFVGSLFLFWYVIKLLLSEKIDWQKQFFLALLLEVSFYIFLYTQILPEFVFGKLAYFLFPIIAMLFFILALGKRYWVFALVLIAPLAYMFTWNEKIVRYLPLLKPISRFTVTDEFPNVLTDFIIKQELKRIGAKVPNDAYGFQGHDLSVFNLNLYYKFKLNSITVQSIIKDKQLCRLVFSISGNCKPSAKFVLGSFDAPFLEHVPELSEFSEGYYWSNAKTETHSDGSASGLIEISYID